MGDAEMPNDPQVPWTEEQRARVNQVIQEEAQRARVAATFLPLVGPLPADTDFVRAETINYEANPLAPGDRLTILDRDTIQLTTLDVRVWVRGAQMADPELESMLTLFRRAANVLARLEDAVVFRGLTAARRPNGGIDNLKEIWQVHGGQEMRGLSPPGPPGPPGWIELKPTGQALVISVSRAIGRLEANGHFGPFAVVLGQELFLVAQTPEHNSMVLPQDRIIPFLGGGPLLRSSTLDIGGGVVVALGGAPVELVVAADASLQFLQITDEPRYLFRVREKIALRIKEEDAIVGLHSPTIESTNN
jgi:uncharacterized linocin/CFP29 family protein